LHKAEGQITEKEIGLESEQQTRENTPVLHKGSREGGRAQSRGQDNREGGSDRRRSNRFKDRIRSRTPDDRRTCEPVRRRPTVYTVHLYFVQCTVDQGLKPNLGRLDPRLRTRFIKS